MNRPLELEKDKYNHNKGLVGRVSMVTKAEKQIHYRADFINYTFAKTGSRKIDK